MEGAADEMYAPQINATRMSSMHPQDLFFRPDQTRVASNGIHYLEPFGLVQGYKPSVKLS